MLSSAVFADVDVNGVTVGKGLFDGTLYDAQCTGGVEDVAATAVEAGDDAATGVGGFVAGIMRMPSNPGTPTNKGSQRPKRGLRVMTTG